MRTALLALVLAACNRSAPRPSADAGSAPLSRFVVVGPDSAPLWAAVALNDGTRAGPRSRFTAAGLDVEVRAVRGTHERSALVENGGADLLLAPLSSVPATSAAHPLVAVAVVYFDAGELGLMATTRFRSLEQLAGARIAGPRPSGAAALAATLVAAPIALGHRAPDALRAALGRIDGTRTAKETVELARHGQLDAVVLPAAERAQPVGALKPLISTREARRALPWLLWADAATVARRPRELGALIHAWLDGATIRAPDAELARAVGIALDDLRGPLSRIRAADLVDNHLLLDTPSDLWDALVAAAGTLDPAASSPSRNGSLLPPLSPPPPPPQPRIGNPHRNDGSLVSLSMTLRFDAGDDRVVDVLRPDQPDLAVAANLASLFAGCPTRLDAIVEPEISGPLSRRRLRAVTDALAARPGVDMARFELALRDTGRATSPATEQRFLLVLCPE